MDEIKKALELSLGWTDHDQKAGRISKDCGVIRRGILCSALAKLATAETEGRHLPHLEHSYGPSTAPDSYPLR